jgi:diguanylate cyclase (GGDEF)-like protein
MNAKHINSALLLAILFTVIAVISVHYLPEKRLISFPSSTINPYLYTVLLPDGTPSGKWIDAKKARWQCTPPPNFQGDYFACNFVMSLTLSPTEGINLSNYSDIALKINYSGSANKIRIAIRNYNPAYSKPHDNNSTKFHSVHIHTKELNKEVKLELSNFSVSEWWRELYNIPLDQSVPELSNAISVTIDFFELPKAGVHELQVEKIEFIGQRINTEHWYLVIIVCWMLGIFLYTIKRVIELRQQVIVDHDQIEVLHTNNEQLKKETDRFRRLSTIDPLTQAYNRFGIDQIVSTLLRCTSDKNFDASAPDYALIVIDIDHFKRINDRRGHDAGDRVLQDISTIIQKNIRQYDFLGRWGGEEFVVILPNTRKEFAIALAEKIRLVIYDHVFEADQPLAVTISCGISDRIANEDFATTFKRADNALYKAKELARNCCIMADDELIH